MDPAGSLQIGSTPRPARCSSMKATIISVCGRAYTFAKYADARRRISFARLSYLFFLEMLELFPLTRRQSRLFALVSLSLT